MIDRFGIIGELACLLLLPALCTSGAKAQIMDSRWSQPFNLSDPANESDRASLTIDRQGNTHAIWVEWHDDGRAVVRYARFDGAAWTAPVLVRDPSPAQIGITSLTIDGEDRLHASWTEGVTASLFGPRPMDTPVRYIQVPASEALDPEQWSSPLSIPVRAFSQSVRVAPDGAVHLLYTDITRAPESVMHCRSVDGGRTWSTPAAFPRPQGVSGPPHHSRLEISSGGTLHAVWEHKFAGEWKTGVIAYSRSVDGGATWSEPSLLDGPHNDNSFIQYGWPQLAVKDSEVGVMWSGGGFAHVGRRFIRSLDDGQTWHPVEQVFGTLHGHAYSDALVHDWQGRLHYMDLLRFPQGIWESTLSGSEWSTPNLVYMHLRDYTDQEDGRLHPSNLDLTAGDGQQVVTFAVEGHRTRLFTIHVQKPALYLPYFLSGGGASTRILVANRGTEPVRLTFKARTGDGAPLDAAFQAGTETVEVAGQSTQIIRAVGPGEEVQSGYLEIAAEGAGPLLVATVQGSGNGGQTVMPAVSAGREFALPVEQPSGVQLKLALLRFTGKPVEATLHDQSGWEVGRIAWEPKNRHETSTIDALFTVPDDFKGMLVLRSEGDFAVAGLRIVEGQESYLPALALDQVADSGTTYIPHYADGSGWSMTFAALNHSDSAASVVANFYDASGNRQSLPFEAGTVDETTLDLSPGGARILSTTGMSEPLKAGYAQFRSDRKASGFAAFNNAEGLSASVASRKPGRRFALIVDDSASAVTALALLHLNKEPVEFRLYDGAGVLVSEGEVPQNTIQVAGHVSELAGIQGDFLGVLVLESAGEFLPLSLRLGSGVLGVNPAFEEPPSKEPPTEQ